MKFDTKCVRAAIKPDPTTGAIVPPIYQSATYVLPEVGRDLGFDYTRSANPTRQMLEEQMAAIESMKFAVAFASGLSSIDALLRLFKAGDHIVSSDDVYGGVSRLYNQIWTRFGLEFNYIDSSRPEEVEAAIRPNTKMIWIETPTNPLLKVTDLEAVGEIAHARGCLFGVDSTFATPYHLRPAEYGADIVMHSTTKYLSGHNLIIGGILLTSDEEIRERLKFMQKAIGAVPSPFDCWLTMEGLKTLSLRMARHSENAIEVAEFLEAHPKVEKVVYPGLKPRRGQATHEHRRAVRPGRISGRRRNHDHPPGDDDPRRCAAGRARRPRAHRWPGTSVGRHRGRRRHPGRPGARPVGSAVMRRRPQPVAQDVQKPDLPDGLVAVVKRACPTCELVAQVLADLVDRGVALTVYSQDDPAFPEAVPGVRDDTGLSVSWHHGIETVPTLLRVVEGAEVERVAGWARPEWERITGQAGIGADLPESRAGCGSLSVDPLIADELAVRFSGSELASRRVELGALEDEFEVAFERGWTDGLPVVPATEARVLRMLGGTTRDPGDVVAVVPPDLVDCTVEQVAVNAVLAGCRPEYLPVVLAAVEAACTDEFNMHGLLATTYFSGPVVIVNGPYASEIGMNSGGNVFGQGNRANATIGRALQLVIRNIGGGRPGGVDRATFGSPGKIAFCFAEREHDSPFEPLAQSRGIESGRSAVTLYAGHGPTAVTDQISRTPESLVRSLAAQLLNVSHPKLAFAMDALLVISPEHGRIFCEAGWDRSRLLGELEGLMQRPADDILRGVDGIDEGVPPQFAGITVPKFRPGGLLIAHAGGDAGMFSAVLGGWLGGPTGSEPVTREIHL
jgi:cystathionine beta-lyase/cystathionine gamma-synthase